MKDITVSNSQDVFNDITKRMWNIPFDNSQFQNENFIINSAGTQERAYRSAALRLQNRLEALKHAHFTERKTAVKLKQLERKLETEQDDLECELIRIEIEEILSGKAYSDKLVNDAIVEANQLYQFISSCPEYTREDFENAERKYFEKKLSEDALGITGALKSLSDMGVNLNTFAKNNGAISYDGGQVPLIGVVK